MRIAIMIDLFGRSMTACEISRHVKRTRGYELSQKLILRRHNEGQSGEDLIRRLRAWSTAEIAVVAARYADEDDSAIAADIGRSWAAVRSCAARLGIKKSRAYMADQRKNRSAKFTGKRVIWPQEVVAVSVPGWGYSGATRLGGATDAEA